MDADLASTGPVLFELVPFDPPRIEPSDIRLAPTPPDVCTDQRQLERVRAGESAAFGELYLTYRPAALRAARGMVRDPELAFDLVAEAFTRVLNVLRDDRGPREQLLPYLLATMRNVAASWGRDSMRWMPVGATNDLEPYVRRSFEPTSDDNVAARFGLSLTSAAFAGLPERWREAIWYLDVERERSAQVSVRLGLSETALRQLAHRARAGLREAYLSEYISAPPVRTDDPVVPTGPAHVPAARLAQVARGRIARTHGRRVAAHLARCSSCTRRLAEATDESASMRTRSA